MLLYISDLVSDNSRICADKGR